MRGGSNRRRIVGCVASALALLVSGICDTAQAAAGADRSGPTRRYVLTDTCYASAKAGVLREKTVTARYTLAVTDRGAMKDGRRRVDVKVLKVAVTVNVPAQKRKGAFDSTKDNTDAELRSWEIVRPASFVGAKLSFVFAADGFVESIRGLESVEKKLSSLLERDFSGTEVAQYVGDLEVSHVGSERMIETWGALLRAAAFPAATKTKGKQECRVDASVPSEAWAATLKLSCRTTSKTSVSNGRKAVRHMASFKTMQPARSKIGPCAWSYQITKGSFLNETVHDKSRKLVSAKRRVSLVLDTTITLGGRKIHLDMTVRHELKLR